MAVLNVNTMVASVRNREPGDATQLGREKTPDPIGKSRPMLRYRLAFPYYQHSPPQPIEQSSVFSVSILVASNLIDPISRARFGHAVAALATVAVPEAPMHENHLV